jgi:hypothetical protein
MPQTSGSPMLMWNSAELLSGSMLLKVVEPMSRPPSRTVMA